MVSSSYQDITLPASLFNFDGKQMALDDLKQKCEQFNQWLIHQFEQGEEIDKLIYSRSLFIDHLLKQLWQYHQIPKQYSSLFKSNRIALIAVGGYGRQELHPLSDIDILILSDNALTPDLEKKISDIVRLLWDLHLDVGHSVRTLKICLQEAKTDITVMTNLIESRLIAGSLPLLNDLRKEIFSKKIWQSSQFYQAKLAEQQARHKQYHSTSYNLEPDIKNSPGGLRDIQTIQWIALRHFGGIDLSDITQSQYLTPEEVKEIESCRQFLWKIRFALHCVIHRYDNRLLFDRQLNIAHKLGYQGDGNKPVENMMREYYQVVHNITELNQMLLQLFKESILTLTPQNKPYSIDENFQVRDKLIDIKDNELFTKKPIMIMQLFYIMLQHPNIEGIYSNTIRQLRLVRRQFTTLLSEDKDARDLFLRIIRHPNAIKKALLPMHQYGILEIYIPEWKNIVGMMQFDLFHAYTVDEHTIRLLLEIELLSSDEGKIKHPNSSRVYSQISKPELLIIAALYHDIAKGQHGDHSKLGAKLVKSFCQNHNINEQDTELVVWLVRYHLLMSVTAQKQDLQDPIVIREFAKLVKNKRQLQYLLCLTVADVCATNETLWNSWKQSLMRELYLLTERLFDSENHQIPQQRSMARQHKNEAKFYLKSIGYKENVINQFWLNYRFDYFLRYTTRQIIWHAQILLNHDLTQSLVAINCEPFHGGTEIFIYSPDSPYLFASVSTEISKKNLNIHDALIFTNKENFALDTFIVLDPKGQILSPDRHHDLKQSIEKILQSPYQRTKVKRLSSHLRHFSIPTQVNFLPTQGTQKTYMELVTLDKPGILACVGEVFVKLEISLSSAKIATIGEHIEDLFILTDKNNQALSDKLCQQLEQEIIQAIDDID